MNAAADPQRDKLFRRMTDRPPALAGSSRADGSAEGFNEHANRRATEYLGTPAGAGAVVPQ